MLFCEEFAVLHGALSHAEQMLDDGLSSYDFHDDQVLNVVLSAIKEVLQGLRCDRNSSDKQLWKQQVVVLMLLLSKANSDPTLLEELDESDEFCAVASGMPAINHKLLVDIIQRCHITSEFLEVVHGLGKTIARKLIYDTLLHITENTPGKYTDLLESITLFLSLSTNLILNDDRPLERGLSSDDIHIGSPGIFKALDKVLTKSLQRCNLDVVGKVAIVQQLLECWNNHEVVPINRAGAVLSLLSLISKSSEAQSGLSLNNISRTSKEAVLHKRRKFLDASQNRDQKSLTKLAVCFHNRFRNDCCLEQERLVLPVMLINTLIEETTNLIQNPGDSSEVLELLKCNSNMLEKDNILAIVSPSEIDNIISTSLESLESKQESLQSNLLSASALESLINALTNLEGEFKTWVDGCGDLTPEERLTLNMYVVEEGLNQEDEWNWIIEHGPQMDHRWLEFLHKHHKLLTSANILHLFQVLLGSPCKQGSLNLYHLQEVIARSFCNLKVGDKNEVLKAVYENYGENKFVIEGDISKRLTAVFNRITSQRRFGDKTVTNEVSLLALQCPSLVIEKIVQTAVCNSGQSEALVQVLCEMPFLYQVTDGHQAPTILCQCLKKQFNQKLSKKEEENGLKFMRLLLQNSCISPKEVMEVMVLPYVFRQSDQQHEISILFTLEVMYLVLDASKDCDWLSALKVPPILYCLCGLTEICRKKWAEQDGDNEAEQIIVVEKADHCLQALLDKVICNMKCMPVTGMKWLYQKMSEYPWHMSLCLLKLYDKCDTLKLPKIIPENAVNFLDIEGRVKSCAKEDDLTICLHMARVSDSSLQLLFSTMKPGFSCLKSCAFEKLVSVITPVFQQSIISEAMRIGEMLLHMASKENGIDLPFPEDHNLPDNALNSGGHKVLWLMNILHYSVLITAKRKPESFSHLTHITRIYIALMEKYCVTDKEVESLEVAAMVSLMVQAFMHCSVQVAALPEICENQLNVLALHILSLLCKKVTSDPETENLSKWCDHKQTVHRCLQFWSSDKQKLFLKNLPD